MTEPDSSGRPQEGVRERKRRETRMRIAEAGLTLFSAHGFDATTMDAIAAEAGISRRTVFHYFKSKDDILSALQTSLGERLVTGLASGDKAERPLAATRKVVMEMIAPFSHEGMIAIDRMMRASEGVQARKQASYLRDEEMLFAELRRLWPAEDEMGLRMVATLTINAVRLSVNAWSSEGGTRPLVGYVEKTFDALTAVLER